MAETVSEPEKPVMAEALTESVKLVAPILSSADYKSGSEKPETEAVLEPEKPVMVETISEPEEPVMAETEVVSKPEKPAMVESISEPGKPVMAEDEAEAITEPVKLVAPVLSSADYQSGSEESAMADADVVSETDKPIEPTEVENTSITKPEMPSAPTTPEIERPVAPVKMDAPVAAMAPVSVAPMSSMAVVQAANSKSEGSTPSSKDQAMNKPPMPARVAPVSSNVGFPVMPSMRMKSPSMNKGSMQPMPVMKMVPMMAMPVPNKRGEKTRSGYTPQIYYVPVPAYPSAQGFAAPYGYLMPGYLVQKREDQPSKPVAQPSNNTQNK